MTGGSALAMILFILDFEGRPSDARRTSKQVIALPELKEYQVQIVANNAGISMNRALRQSSSRWFVTLLAGERVTADFGAQLEELVRRLPDTAAGAMPLIRSETSRTMLQNRLRGPILWRTSAVIESIFDGFPNRGAFALERYVLPYMAAELRAQNWLWPEWENSSWSPSPYRQPRWRRGEEADLAAAPLIFSRPTSRNTCELPPLFTIVLCMYNDAEYVEGAIRSVLAQTNARWELILVDDGSTDDTEFRIAKYRHLPRVKHIMHPVNLGKSAALNTGLNAAGGDWLLELDADDWLAPDCLDQLAKAISQQSSPVHLVYANHYRWRERQGGELIYAGRSRSSSELDPSEMIRSGETVAPRAFRIESLRELGGWRLDDPFGGRLFEDIGMLTEMTTCKRSLHLDVPLYHRRFRDGSTSRRGTGQYERWKRWMETDPACGPD